MLAANGVYDGDFKEVEHIEDVHERGRDFYVEIKDLVSSRS